MKYRGVSTGLILIRLGCNLGLVSLLDLTPLLVQVVNVEQTRLSSDSN